MRANTNMHPYSRVLFLICGLSGSAVCQNTWLLAGFWIAVLIPLTVSIGKFKSHLRFLLIGAVPMFLLLYLSNFIQKVNQPSGLETAAQTVLRIISLATVAQLVLTIPLDHIISTFKAWGMKGNVLILSLGAYTVWADMANRSDKIITARFARGFVAKRTLLSRLSQIPYLIIPLTIGMMRAAAIRSDSWDQKKLLHRIEIVEMDKINYGMSLNVIIFITSLSWLTLNIIVI